MYRREFKWHIQKANVVVARETVKIYIEESRRMSVLIIELAAEILRDEPEGKRRRRLDDAMHQNNGAEEIQVDIKLSKDECSVCTHSNGAPGGCPPRGHNKGCCIDNRINKEEVMALLRVSH